MTAPLSQNAAPDQPPPSLAKSHPVLLAVVIGLGVAIILVMAIMAGLIIRRASSGATPPKPAALAGAPPPVAKPGADTAFSTYYIGGDAEIAEARLQDGKLIVRTRSDIADEVMIFDPATGQMASRITLKKSDQP